MLLSRFLIGGLLWTTSTQAGSYSPALDLNNQLQLVKVTRQAIKNLLSYYIPSQTGVFNQAQTPWHESGMIWCLIFDYTKWTGDTQFVPLVTEALVNMSYGIQHDFLGGSLKTVVQTFLGVWNDDLLWPSQAVVAGAELYGTQAIMGTSNGTWIQLATKTFEQTGADGDDQCGGGLYWSRDRGSPSGSYKSLITQLEFVSQGARNYIQTKNETAFDQTKQILETVTTSGLGNHQTGQLLDGVSTKDCANVTKLLWSYNYGQLLGSLAWMNKATNDSKYLDMTIPFFDFAIQAFAANSSGVIMERCESSNKCNRDQQGFKAVFVRNLAYLYRQTNNETQKATITTIIDTSITAMVNRSCDQDWNCGGNWTTDTEPIKYIRSQHVSTALLVAALGIHLNSSSGLLPAVDMSLAVDSNGIAKPKKGSSNILSLENSQKFLIGFIFFGLLIFAQDASNMIF